MPICYNKTAYWPTLIIIPLSLGGLFPDGLGAGAGAGAGA